MALSIMEVVNGQYRTARSADMQCTELLKRLGYKVRYLAARLAIARSLSLPASPDLASADEDDDGGTPIRGQQLFGDGSDPAAWLALITERAGRSDLNRKEFQFIVSGHWRRGAELLTRDWEESQGNLTMFVAKLADLASLPAEGLSGGRKGQDNEPPLLTASIDVPVGDVAEDAETGEPVVFPLNVPGGSPHIAIMGGIGSGKTFAAIAMLKKIRAIGPVPLLAFDFKGDLAERLAVDFGAEVIAPPRQPVPLNVLSIQQQDDTGLKEAAGRIRESISRVKVGKISGIQSDALRESVFQVLRAHRGDTPATLADIAHSLTAEYKKRKKNPDELTSTLNELTQFQFFDPQLSPSEFFSRSWIIRLGQDSPGEVRRLVINLMLDALDRWLNSQPDAPLVDGRRALRHVCLLDEAHIILQTKLPALSNLVRMSRSKGGVVFLVSQSPDDFEGAEDDFLDNVGLTLAFNTQAKPGPTRIIFGSGLSLADLPVGEALCRIRTEAKTRRVVAWRP